MRWLSIFILSCFIISCTKKVINFNGNDLPGTWKQVLITGGFAGIREVPKDDIRIKFETNQTYTATINFVTTEDGNYSLANAPEPNYYYSPIIINMVDDHGNKNVYGITIRNDSLFLSGGCCDQFDYTYVKQ
jgi:hypothetical protein